MDSNIGSQLVRFSDTARSSTLLSVRASRVLTQEALKSVFMTDDSWPRSLTKIQGALISHHRERRGMSHVELVERVSALGVEMQRTTLINIEQGRRKAISVPEVYAFSYALNIPPILLLVPLGNVDSVEILKGKTVAPWVATKWVQGYGLLDAPIDGKVSSDGPLREKFDALLHHGEILMWHRFLDDLQHEAITLSSRLDDNFSSKLQDEVEQKVFQVKGWRSRIREDGLVPPPLWPEFVALFPGVE